MKLILTFLFFVVLGSSICGTKNQKECLENCSGCGWGKNLVTGNYRCIDSEDCVSYIGDCESAKCVTASGFPVWIIVLGSFCGILLIVGLGFLLFYLCKR